MESVEKKGTVALAKSPNKRTVFGCRLRLTDKNMRGDQADILSVDEHRNVLLDCSGKTEPVSEEVLEAIIGGFEFACKAGPLCGEPVRHLKVDLVDFQLSDEFRFSRSYAWRRQSSFRLFPNRCSPILLEPIYKIIITVASELTRRILTDTVQSDAEKSPCLNKKGS